MPPRGADLNYLSTVENGCQLLKQLLENYAYECQRIQMLHMHSLLYTRDSPVMKVAFKRVNAVSFMFSEITDYDHIWTDNDHIYKQLLAHCHILRAVQLESAESLDFPATSKAEIEGQGTLLEPERRKSSEISLWHQPGKFALALQCWHRRTGN